MTRPAPVVAAAHRRADLDGQFVLCRSESLVPTGWEVRRLGGWLLAAQLRYLVRKARRRVWLMRRALAGQKSGG